MPTPPDASDTSGRAALRYVVAHPVASGRLAVTRIAVESAQVRRHYPRVVNLGIGAAMLAFAATTILGATDTRSRSLRTSIIILGAPMVALVGLTFAVPEGRYGWAYLVLLAPLAGLGVSRLVTAATER